ncbi:MAG: biotin/lipoyl-binding protein, partial [Ignavibacteriaceae bacterium]|nr:biotin/lipoyl-binding protein [Ignavibacteriaceae bacterium]
MATEFKLPELGENIEAADVVAVLVKEGDTIIKDQAILEIETDKATIEVPSSVEGKVTKLLIKVGDKVKVGATILIVDEGGITESKIKSEITKEIKTSEVKTEPEVEYKATPTTKSSGKKKIVDFHLPELGENIEAADVLNVLVKVGDMIETDQAILEIETDKATIEVPSSVAGKVVEVLIKSGDKAKVGQVIIKVEAADVESVETKIENKDEAKETTRQSAKK